MLLPHLSLRATDAPVLLDVCPRAAASLRRILAETSGDRALDQANGVLAAVYTEMEDRLGARLARSVFALAGDGFPEEGDVRRMERWDRPLRALMVDFSATRLPESKRDVLTAMVGHHCAELDALRAAAAARRLDRDDAERVGWLLRLIAWRRFASLGRALARVLSAQERQTLAAFIRSHGGSGATALDSRATA